MEYDFKVVYQKGTDNVVPDFLSRIYVVDQIIDNEEDDRELAKRKNRIFIPIQERDELIEKAHNVHTGHLRIAKLFAFLSKRYFWRSLFHDVKRIVDSCIQYQRIHSKINYCHLCPIEAVYPFQIISLDTGHIPYGQDKNHYFVVAIDHFTRWIEIKSLR